MRVVIAEDSVLLRAGLTRILADAGEEIVATVGAADELMAAVERHQPDLCIVDVRMPPTHTDDGLRAAIAIRQRWPKIGILVLSQYVEERYATELLAGETMSIGYLLKDRVADVSEFLAAVRRVGDGGTALDAEVVAQLLARSRQRDPLERLTPREREVLALMAEGRSNPAIARTLVISDKAVEKHVEQHLHQARPAAGRRRSPPRAGGPAMGEGMTMSDVTDALQRPPVGPPSPPPPPPAPAPSAAPKPRRTPRGVRVAWKVFAAVLVVAGLAWGTYNVVVVLAHEERVETESFPAASLRAIDVRNSAGSVRVLATDGETVDVRAEISEGLRSTGERREIVGDVLELRGSCPNFGSDFCRVSYEISMPRTMALTVHADDGSIDVDGLSGPLDLDSDNGSVEVRRASGSLRLSTDNGHVEGTDLRSSTVTADSDNGRVTLAFTAAPTTVIATSDNGSVEVVVPDDGEAYALDLSTDNGSRTEDIRVDSASPRTITISHRERRRDRPHGPLLNRF